MKHKNRISTDLSPKTRGTIVMLCCLQNFGSAAVGHTNEIMNYLSIYDHYNLVNPVTNHPPNYHENGWYKPSQNGRLMALGLPHQVGSQRQYLSLCAYIMDPNCLIDHWFGPQFALNCHLAQVDTIGT